MGEYLIGVDINGNEQKIYWSTFKCIKVNLINTFRNESFPAHEFSVETGVPNLHKNWSVNFNHDWYLFCYILNINTKFIVNYQYKILIKDNPELSTIDVGDDITLKHDVIYGAVSKINFDDIESYIQVNKKEILNNSLQYMKAVYEKYGTYPEWSLSTKTYNYLMSY